MFLNENVLHGVSKCSEVLCRAGVHRRTEKQSCSPAGGAPSKSHSSTSLSCIQALASTITYVNQADTFEMEIYSQAIINKAAS